MLWLGGVVEARQDKVDREGLVTLVEEVEKESLLPVTGRLPVKTRRHPDLLRDTQSFDFWLDTSIPFTFLPKQRKHKGNLIPGTMEASTDRDDPTRSSSSGSSKRQKTETLEGAYSLGQSPAIVENFW